MTREEAINEIKSWAIPSKKGREVLETLIPELRENKDENVKNKSGYYKAGKFWKASTLWNATRNKVPQRVSNIYNILRECTWNVRTLQDFAKEVKNVQEVSLDYPIILDMNGNILDGAHRVVKAYLEGKDIDIVYLGDDEWPEPDYDEEKAVRRNDDERIKKSLIKFLTDIKEISESGRTSWAVRKEDAEMCKSFLDYLGKQKEQKPLTIESAYEKFINPETLKEARTNKYIRAQLLWELMHNGIITEVDYLYLTDDKRKPWTEEEYLKAYRKGFDVAEQLKQKEQNGEDEGTDFTIYHPLKNGKGEYECIPYSFYGSLTSFSEDKDLIDFLRTCFYTKEECNDWIKQQKEQKPAEFTHHETNESLEEAVTHQMEDDGDIDDFVRKGIDDIVLKYAKLGAKWQQEQKQVQTAEEKEFVRTIKSIISDFIRDKKPEYVGYYQRICDWLDGRHVPFSCGHEKGQLAEWSDEDKKMLNHLIDKIQENLNIRMPGGHYFGISNDEKETFLSWLICLPERFNLPPKQEWSEADEAAYTAFICEVVNEGMSPTVEQVKWLRSIRDRLKSFRSQPKQEWNDEDKSILNTIITDIEFVQRKCGIGTDEWNIRSKAIWWIKSLPERFSPLKQEWKEVELEFRGEKVKIKRPFFRDDKGHEYSTTEQDEDVAWYALRAWCDKKGISLYDLYPKYEWSEEGEGSLKELIHYFESLCDCLATEKRHIENRRWLSFLKSLRPSWKPSKEQMDSLRDTIANTKGYSYSIYLPELYEQLKKLP